MIAAAATTTTAAVVVAAAAAAATTSTAATTTTATATAAAAATTASAPTAATADPLQRYRQVAIIRTIRPQKIKIFPHQIHFVFFRLIQAKIEYRIIKHIGQKNSIRIR